MDWLLRTVTMPIALHDIMWWFVSSFSVPLVTEDGDYESDNEWKDEFVSTQCQLPLLQFDEERISWNLHFSGFDSNL